MLDNVDESVCFGVCRSFPTLFLVGARQDACREPPVPALGAMPLAVLHQHFLKIVFLECAKKNMLRPHTTAHPSPLVAHHNRVS